MEASASILPKATTHNSSAPSLEALVDYLLTAKRSLSAISHVNRANDLVKQTRDAVETDSALSSKISFMHYAVSSQIDLLRIAQIQTRDTVQKENLDFQALISRVDRVDSRLQKTLNQLRSTIVDAKLRPEAESSRTLIDFVEETSVKGLTEAIKESINVTVRAWQEYEKSDKMIETELIRQMKSLGWGSDKGSKNSLQLPQTLQEMEDYAKEMATDLEGLVRHFDLCVNAIKHVEGGSAVAQEIAGDLTNEVGLGIESDTTDLSPAPLSEEEKLNMLEVLEKDSHDVDDVVDEIRDRLADMENRFEPVDKHVNCLYKSYEKAYTAFLSLETAGRLLPQNVTLSHLFLLKSEEEKEKVHERMEEMEALREFYEGFLGAYDDLIIEVSRRMTVQRQMRKMAEDFENVMRREFTGEIKKREEFNRKQGDFLPSDIWSGLMEPLPQFDIRLRDVDSNNVPELSSSMIREAVQRASNR